MRKNPRRSGGPTVVVAHPSADLYGSDRVMLESVRGFVDDGARVIVTLPAPGPLVPEILARGATVAYSSTPVLRKSLLRPVAFLGLIVRGARDLVRSLLFLRRHRPDVVYVSTVTIPLWLLAARLGGVRTVCHVHEAEGSAPRLVRLVLALPLVLAHTVITNSEYSRTVVTGSVPALTRRTRTIYNGVPGPDSAPPARVEIDGPLQVVYVGRLSPRKGVDLLVPAAGILRERGIDVHVSLVGAVFPGYEWYETELRELVRDSGLEHAVTFAGFQPSVWDALRAADVVVVPSRLDEPFGNTAVEAILAARPVVVSDTSGLREAAAGYASAVFVPADDAGAIADALQRIRDEWAVRRDAAVADSGIAETRHSLTTYRRAMTTAVVGPKGRTASP